VLEGLYREQAKKNQSAGGGDKKSQAYESGSSNLTNPVIDTREKLADLAGVSTGTFSYAEEVLDHGSEALQEAVRNKEVSVSAAAQSRQRFLNHFPRHGQRVRDLCASAIGMASDVVVDCGYDGIR
jgi:hypothetical protein